MIPRHLTFRLEMNMINNKILHNSLSYSLRIHIVIPFLFSCLGEIVMKMTLCCIIAVGGCGVIVVLVLLHEWRSHWVIFGISFMTSNLRIVLCEDGSSVHFKTCDMWTSTFPMWWRYPADLREVGCSTRAPLRAWTTAPKITHDLPPPITTNVAIWRKLSVQHPKQQLLLQPTSIKD